VMSHDHTRGYYTVLLLLRVTGSAPPDRRGGGGRAEAPHGLARPRPERDPPLERPRGGLREQRRLGRERVRPRRRLRPPPVADLESPHPAVNARQQRGDAPSFSGGRRRNRGGRWGWRACRRRRRRAWK